MNFIKKLFHKHKWEVKEAKFFPPYNSEATYYEYWQLERLLYGFTDFYSVCSICQKSKRGYLLGDRTK